MSCVSSDVPSVTVTSACVSPRVKSAEPWVRGRTPASIAIGRIWSNARPSRRLRPWRIVSRVSVSTSSERARLANLRVSGWSSGTSSTPYFLTSLIFAYDSIFPAWVRASIIGPSHCLRTAATNSARGAGRAT